jgi:hypothetical protein
MKQIIKIVAGISLITASLNAVVPIIIPRSQSVDTARNIVGVTRYINLYDQEQVYGCWAFTLEYEKAFRSHQISRNLFGADLINDPKPFIQITGSQAGNRDATDWLADYFGLPTDFRSRITFDPKVDSVLFDISFYLGLDEWCDGLFFWIHAPIVHTRWKLNFNEQVIQPGTNGYDPGYFGPTAVPRSSLVKDFTSFASGLGTPNLGPNIFFNPLENAKIVRGSHSKTRLSDIQAMFGWNFLQCDDHHFGLYLYTAAPAGNRPEGEFLFEPIVGNAHHWELGLGTTFHYLLFVDECTDRYVGFYGMATLSTLFGSRQTRTFDLVDKPMSRYMLVERLGTPVMNLFLNAVEGTAAGSVAPSMQFQNLYVPLANISTFKVNVRMAAQFDFSAMLYMQWCQWDFNIGYNYWARTCENIRPICQQCSIPFDGNVNFALKGDARTYGFVAQDAVNLPPGITPGQPIPLSATESQADIHSGTNTPIGTPFNPSQNQNPKIDLFPQKWAMVSTNDNSDQIVIFPTDNGSPATQQRSTLTPVLIMAGDIDLEAAETKGLSNRFFAHFSYNWDACECDWIPYLGAGGFIEFAHNDSDECSDPEFDDSCQTVAFSQWGVWIKGGFAFN